MAPGIAGGEGRGDDDEVLGVLVGCGQAHGDEGLGCERVALQDGYVEELSGELAAPFVLVVVVVQVQVPPRAGYAGAVFVALAEICARGAYEHVHDGLRGFPGGGQVVQVRHVSDI